MENQPSDKEPAPTLTEDEIRKVGEFLRGLSSDSKLPLTTLFGNFSKKSSSNELPVVNHLLMEILKKIAMGQMVEVLPSELELTTQQAADILNVSRPYVIKLLEEGQIPSRKVGTHRRIRVDDLKRYKEESDAIREKALDELMARDQRLKLFT